MAPHRRHMAGEHTVRLFMPGSTAEQRDAVMWALERGEEVELPPGTRARVTPRGHAPAGTPGLSIDDEEDR